MIDLMRKLLDLPQQASTYAFDVGLLHYFVISALRDRPIAPCVVLPRTRPLDKEQPQAHQAPAARERAKP